MGNEGLSQALLIQMIEAAQARLEASGLSGDQVAVVPQTKKGVEMMLFFSPSMMDAAEIYYDQDACGWVCNFHLSPSAVAQGGPEVFGSPSTAPLATQDDAFDWGVKTLSVLLAAEAEGRGRLA
jgi:hypothetical protein